MGVDYEVCNNCGRTFHDCGDYVCCDTCYKEWCCDECAEADGYRVDVDNEEEYSTSCNYCRKEDFEDYQLLQLALSLLGINRDQLIEKYKEMDK